METRRALCCESTYPCLPPTLERDKGHGTDVHVLYGVCVSLSWELWNRVVGGDATRGLLTVVSDLLGLNMPLQPPLRPDYSLHMLDAFLGASTGMDADGSACCWAVYKLGSGSGQGGGAEQMQPLSLECNDRFSAMYVSRREMLTPIADGMARPEALWAHR